MKSYFFPEFIYYDISLVLVVWGFRLNVFSFLFAGKYTQNLATHFDNEHLSAYIYDQISLPV